MTAISPVVAKILLVVLYILVVFSQILSILFKIGRACSRLLVLQEIFPIGSPVLAIPAQIALVLPDVPVILTQILAVPGDVS